MAEINENLISIISNMTSDEQQEFRERIAKCFVLSMVIQQNKLDMTPMKIMKCMEFMGVLPKSKEAQEEQPDFQFAVPKVHECFVCTKCFFHKIPFRRHMIRHLQREYYCLKCCKSFWSKIAHKRHTLHCRTFKLK